MQTKEILYEWQNFLNKELIVEVSFKNSKKNTRNLTHQDLHHN